MGPSLWRGLDVRVTVDSERVGDPERITGSAYAGKIGIPAYFPATSFPDLLVLRGDTGARELLRRAASVADEGLALDIDTQEDFDRARKRLERA